MVSINGKPSILHDADDWLFEYVPGFLEWNNQEYGTNNALGVPLKKEHVKDWDLTKVLGCTQEQRKERIARFYLTDSFRDLAPSPEAQSMVKSLSYHLNQGVCTSRPDTDKIKESTYFQFRTHYGAAIPRKRIHFTNFQPKDDILLKYKPRGFTDDAFDNHVKLLKNSEIYKLVKKGDLKLFINTQPWNQDLSQHKDRKYLDNIIRLERPKDILKHVL